MSDTAREAAGPFIYFALGVVAALAGAVIAGFEADHSHGSFAHVPHQIFIATPLALLGGLLLREHGTPRFFAAFGWAMLGLVAGNVVLFLAA